MQTASQTTERPKQARSKARRLAMIEYGAQVFAQRDLDAVSIADITAGLGYSTGSFYSYFADKAELFVEVQTWTAQQLDLSIQDAFAPEKMQPMDLPARLRLCIDFALAFFRSRTGLIRSALGYERRIPQGWAPHRQSTSRICAAAAAGLNAADADKLNTAIQLAFGLMVNALLHDPGPLRLHDPQLADKICAALTPYLASPPTT